MEIGVKSEHCSAAEDRPDLRRRVRGKLPRTLPAIRSRDQLHVAAAAARGLDARFGRTVASETAPPHLFMHPV